MVDTSEIFTINLYMKYATIPASVILVILVLLQKRARPNPCGYTRPGLVVPMPFLGGYEDRWSYALAFGSITGILINVFLYQATSDSTDNFFCTGPSSSNDTSLSTEICNQVWVKSLLLQAQSLVASLVCAPQFLCITTTYKLVGSVLGFFYSTFWIVFYIVGAVRNELDSEPVIGNSLLLRDIPVILCFIGLCIRSLWAIYKCYINKRFRVQRVENLVERHQVDHVTALFRPPPAKEDLAPEGLVQKVKGKAKAQLFPHFKLPARIICIAFVQVIIIYYVGVSLTGLGIFSQELIKLGLASSTGNVTGAETTILAIFDGVYVTSEVAGLLSSVVYVALFVINYRVHMVNIYRGNKEQYEGTSNITPARHLAASMRLPGYQIAYTLWGLMIIFIMMFISLSIICYGIFFLTEFGYLKSVIYFLLQSLSVPLTTIAIFYLQVLLARQFLLQPKVNEKDKEHPLNVDNRHLYEVMAYTLVFSNLLVGVASALFRTCKSLVLGLIFLARLDRCLLMRGFESMDPGYMAYVGSLLVDNAHNHPVMRTFCALLVRLTCSPQAKVDRGIAYLLEPAKCGTNSRAARRWHLAYTLLKNPDLLPRRKLAMLLARSADDNDNDQGDDSDADKGYSSSASDTQAVDVSMNVSKSGEEMEVSLHSVLRLA
ncbi:stimulated by retinoic acid gene 6 protein-like [Babylonia areolata]|uniref:stimulated by retinoic acid gene 6 protein-like n=1 Tax=Babylonia areolata TaxID=304850 RepID=UPI003FD19BB3